jgi:hypothetical protein
MRGGGWRAEQQRQQTNAWSPGQKILNDTGARQPEHTFHQPVPIVAHIVWADDGEETTFAAFPPWWLPLSGLWIRSGQPSLCRGCSRGQQGSG